MERTDLQRLYAHKATIAASSLEDFTTEALCIAVGRDPRPLTRALQGVDGSVWADARSGVPSIDLSSVTIAKVGTQHYLYHEGLRVAGWIFSSNSRMGRDRMRRYGSK